MDQAAIKLCTKKMYVVFFRFMFEDLICGAFSCNPLLGKLYWEKFMT